MLSSKWVAWAFASAAHWSGLFPPRLPLHRDGTRPMGNFGGHEGVGWLTGQLGNLFKISHVVGNFPGFCLSKDAKTLKIISRTFTYINHMVSQARNGKLVKTMWRLIWFSPLWYANAERSIDWFGTHSTCRTSFPHIEWHKVRIVTSTQIWCFTRCDGSLTNAADSMCAPKHAVQFLWVCGLQPTESLFESIIGCHKMLWNAAMLCTPLLHIPSNPEGQDTLFNMNQALGCQFHGLCLTKGLSNVLYHAGSKDSAHIMIMWSNYTVYSFRLCPGRLSVALHPLQLFL